MVPNRTAANPSQGLSGTKIAKANALGLAAFAVCEQSNRVSESYHLAAWAVVSARMEDPRQAFSADNPSCKVSVSYNSAARVSDPAVLLRLVAMANASNLAAVAAWH